MAAKQAKTDHYSVLKLVTTCLVVLAHTTWMYTGTGAISMPADRILLYLSQVIYSFHMPLFVFLSGAVYFKCISAGKYARYFPFIASKAKRLLIPYLFCGCVVVAPVMVALNITNQSFLEYVIKGILLGKNSRHLWYLTALFLCFAVSGLLRPLLVRWRPAPVLVFLAAVPLSFFSPRFPAMLSIAQAVKFYCYFMGGYVFAANPKVEGAVFSRKSILIGSTALFLLLTTVRYAWLWNGVVERLLAFSGIFMCLAWTEIIARPICRTKLYAALQPAGMGVYLFHPMIIYLCFFAIQNRGLNPILASAGIFLFSFAVSYGLTRLVQKLRLGVLIGE